MASTADIKNGLCIRYSNDIYMIIQFQHVKPGKGPAFVRTKLKSVTSGKVVDNTFPSGHKIETVNVERRKYQFLYKVDETFHLMNSQTYDQLEFQADFIPNNDLLKEEDIVDVLFSADDEMPLLAEIPMHVELEVTYTEPGLKGDTATNASKPATLETGAEIKVPLFVNQGDVIKIDTRDRSYVERVKK